MENNLITIDKGIYESLEGELVKLRERVSDLEEKLCQQEVGFQYAADNVPGMIYKFQLKKDGTMSFPYVSSRCWEFYELEPEEVKQNPQLLFEMIHDDDFLRLQETINISAQTLQKWESEWRIKTSSGKQKWLYGVSNPVVQPSGDIVWDGCVIDISRRVLAMGDLQQREALLDGMKNATSCLLTTQNYDTSINTALAELAKATAVDRIYIFENHSPKLTKELFLSQRWEWVKDGVNSEQDYPLLQNLSYNDFSPLWYECLSQGESIITVEDESQIQGSRSIFVIPIQVKGKWWGFIGFEDYTTLRQWSDAYKSVLQAFAMNLGGAIATHETEYELKCLNKDLERQVEERTLLAVETETRLNRLAANVPGMLYQYQLYPDGDIRLSYVSDGCRELVELEPEQVRRNPDIFTNTIHHQDVVGFNQSMADCIPTLKNWEYEWRIITPSGKEKWLQGFSRLEQQPSGAIFSDGCIIDITQRKLAEAQSQEQEQFLRSVYDGSEHAIFVVDVLENGTLRFAGFNPACERATGICSEQVTGKKPSEVFGNILGEQVQQKFIECVELSETIVYEECFNFDGTPSWWLTTLNPLQNTDGRIYRLVGTTLNITERKQMEEVVRSSEKNLRTLLDSVCDAIFIHDLDGNIIDVNEQMLQMFGVNRNEVTQMSIPVDFSASDNPIDELPKIWEKVVNGVMPKASSSAYRQLFEWKAKRPHDNYIFDVEVFLRKVTLNSQDIILANVRDITERKKAEAEIQAKQHFIQRITDSSPSTIYIYDLEKQQNIYANHELAAILGYSSQEIQEMGNNLFQKIIHPEDLAKVVSGFQKIAASEDGEIHESEYRVKQADGEYRWLYSRDTVFTRNLNGKVTQFLGVATDITERKLAEIKLQNTLHELKNTQAQLIQSEKMSSLGQMVAGVAHEINNPVNFIHGNLTPATQYAQDVLGLLELYQQHYPNPPENIQEEIETVELEFLKEDFIKMLNSMKQGTQRIREIVLSLRNFSRLDEAEFKPVDIHEGIDSTLMILQNRLKAKPNFPEIEIVKNYAPLPPIDCFPSQLNQVLMNILANAIDALESQKSLATPQIQIHTKLIENNRVAIHLLDNGSGIPPQIQSKLFDPFFTTKEVGKGTGLGLSISYQIVVNKHGGNLSLFSIPGQGTEFIIEIPVNQTNNNR
ncbi:MAG: PAS domain S-box protein [Rivularia sp. (in: cyanobacteria)]